MHPAPNPRFRAQTRNVDRSESHTFSPTRGDGRMTLEELFGSEIVNKVHQQGGLVFQTMGDTGNGSVDQKNVALAMARDLHPTDREKGPLFFLHLGDIIYGPNKIPHYTDRFYRPYLDYIQAPDTYDAVILGIPGNHDGEVRSAEDAPTLNAFLENFCQLAGQNAPLAETFGVTMPDQPGAYWWLDAPFIDLIGLYSNSKENDGMLGADKTETHQVEWLHRTLATIAQRRQAGERKALVMAVHHPPFSRGLSETGFGHPGSPTLLAQMDQASQHTGIWPDTVLSAHAHNYQRYMRRVVSNGTESVIPYFIAGTGGFGLQEPPLGIGHEAHDVVYANGLESFGYLQVKVDAFSVSTTFIRTDSTHRNMFETTQIDLQSGQRIHPVPIPGFRSNQLFF